MIFPGFPVLPPFNLIDTILGVNPNLNVSISILYNTHLKSQTTTSDALCNSWSAELGEDIDPAAFTVQGDSQSSLV